MNETKKRIAEYKKKLPKLKEKVLATALLVILAFAMATTSTFAWLVLSRAPEVTGATTALAANGNLEIALVGPDGALPLASAVGDSQLPIAQRNLTWGNLVNLSDPVYGLDELVLRPAQLNLSSLLTSPLYGAVYTPDGRMEKLNSNFAYAVWDPTGERFFVKDEYGVRAISSTTVEAVGFAQQVLEKREAAEEANLKAGTMYTAIMQNEEWMNSLATVMGTYMTAKMNASQGDASLTNPTLNKEDVENLRDIFGSFVDIYEQMFEAEAELLNYQLFLLNNSETGSTPYTPYTTAMVKADSVNEKSLKDAGLLANGLDQMKTDYPNIIAGWNDLTNLCETGGTLKWADSGINGIVNSLMDVGKCTLDGTPINNIGASNASGYLDGNTHSAVITNGVLFEFEKLNGTRCDVRNLSVSAKVKRMGITVPATISVNITTSAPLRAQFVDDLEYSDTLNKGAKGTEVAEDTYGLAVDFWVRTNAVGSYLMLQGNVLTKTEEVDVTGKDANGNTVNIYTLTRSMEDNGETVSYPIDLYQKDSTWYNATTHEVVTLENGETPTQKKETVTTVIGYEGENRVWDDSMLSVDATTQGSGSCYVYYADTPEDQARSLRLLEAFCVVFIDDEGNKLATAEMDTEHFFAENGRVTVPLALSSTDAIDIGTDINGTKQYAITPLEQNVPKRVTALIYLDGTKLTNNDVLAAADIQGQLNIQFGSSVELNSLKDEALSNKERYVSASVSKNKFEYDTATEPMKTTVTVNVTGDQPTTMTGFFLRKINNSQGSREEIMTFTKDAGGAWVADYTFKYPGNYILRSVELDGVEYDLKIPEGGDYPTVEVTGFTISQLRVDGADVGKHINIMTANSTSSVNVTLAFATNDPTKMPSTVSGRFLRDDGAAANIIFTYNPNQGVWKGDATFLTSGEYTLQYLVLDGEYTELDPGLWHTATVYLGMKVAVYTTSPLSFRYLPSEWVDDEGNLTEDGEHMANLKMQVRIMDNTGEPMIGLTDVELQYMMQGTSIAERGMNTDLTWNATTGYYEGTFSSKVGMYDFGYVSVGGDMITNDTTSPSFKIISPEPPKFNSGLTPPYQFAPDGNAYLKVKIDNCQAATVYADITKNGVAYATALQGYLDSDGNWKFDIPQDDNGKQDGIWKITQLRLWDVYDIDGNRYTEEAPLIFDMTDVSDVEAKVVATITVTFAEDKSQNLTGNNFMVAYTKNLGLYVDIIDFAGAAVPNVKSVKLTFTYNGSSSTYGGYQSNDLSNATEGAIVTVDLVDDGSGTRFVQKSNATFLFAGEYTTKLTFEVNGKITTYSSTDTKPLANMPMITVSSNKPTVKVTGVSPTGTFKVNSHANAASGGGFTEMTGVSNSFTDYNACVYIEYTGAIDVSLAAWRYYAAPSVELTLYDMPETFTEASVAFNHPTTTYARTYTFTPENGLIQTNEIGHADEPTLTDANPKLYYAGKQTVSQMTVVYGGVTYTVDLSHEVTINQLQYPPYAEFKINDSTFTGTTPSRIFGTPQADGTFTVTLPGSQTWIADGLSAVDGDFVLQSDNTDQVWTGSWKLTSNGYTTYNRNIKIYTATSMTTTWDITKVITGWKVGNTTYKPGETVQITGAQTITAVISATNGPTTTQTETATRTVTTFTKTGTSYREPNGTKVSSTTNTDVTTYN